MSTAIRHKQIGAKRTGELFVERGLLTPETLEQALAHQKKSGGRLGQVIMELGLSAPEDTERELAFALTTQYGLPCLSLAQYEIDQQVIRMVPEDVARRHCLIPVDQIGNALSVAIADPALLDAVQELEALTHCAVQLCISTPSDIQQAIARHYKTTGSAKTAPRPAAPRRHPSAQHHGRRASLQARVLEVLIANQLLTEAQVKQALAVQRIDGTLLFHTLIEQKLVKELDLLSAISQGLGIPLISLSRVKIDPDLLTLIPRDFARHEQLIPVSRLGQMLTVAMADPLNVYALDALKMMTGLSVSPVLARAQELRDSLSAHYGVGVEETVETMVREQAADTPTLDLVESAEGETDVNRLLQLTQALPVVRITDALLARAIGLRASDLLVEPSEQMMFVRYRVDGLLQEAAPPPAQFQQAVISRLKVMAELNIAERRLPQDGHFSFKAESRVIDCRVSVLPTVFGEKVAIRILDKSQAKLDVQRLGFDAEDLSRLAACAAQPHGMILATGPTGSGKTTTLYSLLKSIDRPEKNIVTVEDPVEFRLEGINQVSAKAGTGLTFARALRFILRQDPDVIMVGEIRDGETADMAVKSALTGHLVLSTLHTTSATGALVRLINMGVEPFLLSSCLLGVVGQRLVRRVCPHCRKLYTPPRHVAEKLGLLNKQGEIPQLARGTGCRLCAQSGYHGRELIAEVFVVTPEIRKLIASNAGGRELEEAAKQSGMRTLREHGLQKALSHVTSLEEIFRTTIGELVVE
ncbi:MAG: ATPase, T2SS/T4P/T4SS family [Candidatus Omnitrophota bacterium]|nr:ATPase, T2SS/T4P/T4SS family [Candidatus Omnitrophota bacterium]